MSSMWRSHTAEPHTSTRKKPVRKEPLAMGWRRIQIAETQAAPGFPVVAGAGFEPATFGL